MLGLRDCKLRADGIGKPRETESAADFDANFLELSVVGQVLVQRGLCRGFSEAADENLCGPCGGGQRGLDGNSLAIQHMPGRLVDGEVRADRVNKLRECKAPALARCRIRLHCAILDCSVVRQVLGQFLRGCLARQATDEQLHSGLLLENSDGDLLPVHDMLLGLRDRQLATHRIREAHESEARTLAVIAGLDADLANIPIIREVSGKGLGRGFRG
mmetsp:Transcript_98014/g.277213  ORF Transcript_98014/g.277213 Transcript_98014/m.277213 type:complete len:216 (+) Transcript_98014:519-1166(+)